MPSRNLFFVNTLFARTIAIVYLLDFVDLLQDGLWAETDKLGELGKLLRTPVGNVGFVVPAKVDAALPLVPLEEIDGIRFSPSSSRLCRPWDRDG